jgi:hypothetical protein
MQQEEQQGHRQRDVELPGDGTGSSSESTASSTFH